MIDLTPKVLAWVRSQVFTTKDYIYLKAEYTGRSPKCACAHDTPITKEE